MKLETKTSFPSDIILLSIQESATIKGGCCDDKRRPIKTRTTVATA